MQQHSNEQIDVDSVRRDFPILGQMHHSDVPLIYLDNAASSQKPRQVIDAMSAYYLNEHANVHRGIHKLSEAATDAFERARTTVKSFIGAASRREIVFTRGTTESINLVAQSWGRQNLRTGDVVLSTVMEHHANIVPWQMLSNECGFTIKYVPVLPDGTLDLVEYERVLKSERVKLVAVTQCSNVLGTINPVDDMARMAHDAGALILIDGAQSIAHMPVNVQRIDADFFVFSGHKMFGPTGIGVLYGKRQLLEAMPPWMGGGGMIGSVTLDQCTWNELPYKFEAGTPSIAEGIGLGAAVDYLNTLGMAAVHRYTSELTAYALGKLGEIPEVRIVGSAPARAGLISFNVDDIHPHDAAQLLDRDGIAVRAGHHCAMPLHDTLGLPATVRASFAPYNTFEEVDALAASLRRAISLYAVQG